MTPISIFSFYPWDNEHARADPTSANDTDEAWSLGTDCADCECKLWSPVSILRVTAFRSFPKQISLFLPSLTLWTSISFLGKPVN